jgi:hypothetical protein
MLLEQYTGNYRSSTQTYVGGMAILVLLLCVPIVIAIIQGKDSADASGGTDDSNVPDKETRKKDAVRNFSRIGIVVGMAALLVYTFETVGYLIGFTLFLVISLRLLEVKKYWLIGLITLIAVAIVHFIFVQWLGVRMPAGVLQGYL